MPYLDTVDEKVTRAPRTIGNQLGRYAIKLDFSVIRIAQATGATRMTVYNWFNGGHVSNSYIKNVEKLMQILETAVKNNWSADDAWRVAIEVFDLDN